MHEPDPSAPPTPPQAALAFAVGVLLAGIALLLAEWDRPPTWREKAESRFSPGRVESHEAGRKRPAAMNSDPLPAFATLTLEHKDLPARGSVSLSLGLAEPSADAEPRPVSVLSVRDQRSYDTQARLDADRMIATIEVPAEFLQPGTYLVQMKTTERTHFPLRRYVVEVR